MARPTDQPADKVFARRLRQLHAVWFPPDGPRPSMEPLAAAISANPGQIVLSRVYLYKLLSGEITNPSLSRAGALAWYYQVPLEYFTALVSDAEAQHVLQTAQHAAQQTRARRAELLRDLHALVAESDETLAGLVGVLGGSVAATDLETYVGAAPAALEYYTDESLRGVRELLTRRAALLNEIRQTLTKGAVTRISLPVAQLASSPVEQLATVRDLLRLAHDATSDATAADPAPQATTANPDQTLPSSVASGPRR